MAESKEAVALELAKLILNKSAIGRSDSEIYTKENVLAVFKECLAAADTSYKPEYQAL